MRVRYWTLRIRWPSVTTPPGGPTYGSGQLYLIVGVIAAARIDLRTHLACGVGGETPCVAWASWGDRYACAPGLSGMGLHAGLDQTGPQFCETMEHWLLGLDPSMSQSADAKPDGGGKKEKAQAVGQLEELAFKLERTRLSMKVLRTGAINSLELPLTRAAVPSVATTTTVNGPPSTSSHDDQMMWWPMVSLQGACQVTLVVQAPKGNGQW